VFFEGCYQVILVFNKSMRTVADRAIRAAVKNNLENDTDPKDIGPCNEAGSQMNVAT
jgi:hypothetical protein